MLFVTVDNVSSTLWQVGNFTYVREVAVTFVTDYIPIVAIP